MKEAIPSNLITRVIKRSLPISVIISITLAGSNLWLAIYPAYLINFIIITAVGLVWIINSFTRDRIFPVTPLDLPLFAWLSVYLIASIVSVQVRQSLEWFAYFLTSTLIFYFFVSQERKRKMIHHWISLFLIASSLIFVIGFLELFVWYVSWLNIGGIGQLIPPATVRIKSTMGHANILAAYITILLPLGISRWMVERSKIIKFLLTTWCIAAVVLIFFTSSRGGWVGALAALSTFLCFVGIDKKDKLKQATKHLIAHPITSGLVILFGMIIVTGIRFLMMHQIQHPSHPTADPRWYIWKVAWSMFRTHPILGTGPGTYGSSFLSTYSIPPDMLLLHAHNFLINQLGENGLLGFVTCIWLGIVLIIMVLKRWRMEPEGGRMLLAGSISALIGMSVHSQFETPQTAIIINVITALLLAYIIAPIIPQIHHRQIIGSSLILIGWIMTISFGFFAIWSYDPYHKAISAFKSKDWETAKYWIDVAVKRDPSMAYYHFQAGIIHAKLALDEDSALRNLTEAQTAIREYEQGLLTEDSYSLNWASLGVLYWAIGDQILGIEAMEHAVSLAPSSPEMNKYLGKLYEIHGDKTAAYNSYQIALELEPEWVGDNFFQETKIRSDAASKFPLYEADTGWKELIAEDYSRAKEIFSEQLTLNNAQAYLGLGLSMLGMNDFTGAERAIRTAEFIAPNDIDVKDALVIVYRSLDKQDQANAILSQIEDLRAIRDTHYNLFYLRDGGVTNFILSDFGR